MAFIRHTKHRNNLDENVLTTLSVFGKLQELKTMRKSDDFNIYRIPIIIIGDTSCGKTTLMNSFMNQDVYDIAGPTIGVDYFNRLIETRDGVRVLLKLWDTAGQERYRSLTKSYYRRAMGILIAYDVTNKWSFIRLDDWLQDAKTIVCNNDVIYQLIGCKCDLEHHREVTAQEGLDFAKKHGMKFLETSAFKHHNVDETFATMAEDILDKIRTGEVEGNVISPEPEQNVKIMQKLSNKMKECQPCQCS